MGYEHDIVLTQFLYALYTRIRFRMTCMNIQGLYHTRNTRRKHAVLCSDTNNLAAPPTFHPPSTLCSLRVIKQFTLLLILLHYACFDKHTSAQKLVVYALTVRVATAEVAA